MKILLLLLITVNVFQQNIVIQDEYLIEEIHIIYGQYLGDAYMMISDIQSGEVYNEIIIDEGHNESFVYLAEVKHDQFIMVLEKYNVDTETYLYSLILYNTYGEIVDRLNLVDKPTGFYNHHNVLVVKINNVYFYLSNDLELTDELMTESKVLDSYKIQFQGQAFINGELVEEIMINEPGEYEIMIVAFQYEYVELVRIDSKVDILGETYLDGYIGDVQIISKGDLFINGKEYLSGDIVSNPGIYEVVIVGKNEYIRTFSFRVYPNLVYYDGDDQFPLREGMVFDFPVRIYSDADSIKLNGEVYQGALLTSAGDYFIELVVDNIIIETLNISIISRVDGVRHQETYKEVKLFAFGEVFLNGSKVDGFQLLENPGTYQIEVKNQDDIYEEIEFYIVASNSEENPSLLPYGILVISLIGLGITLFKK